MISLKYCSINQMLLSISDVYLICDNFNFQPSLISWNDPNYSTIVVLKIRLYLEIWKSRKINFSDETSRQFCFPSISETQQNWSCHRHPSQPPRSWWSPPPHWGARPGCSWWSSTPPSWSDRHCPCRTPWSCERCPRQRCFLACKATFKVVILNMSNFLSAFIIVCKISCLVIMAMNSLKSMPPFIFSSFSQFSIMAFNSSSEGRKPCFRRTWYSKLWCFLLLLTSRK